jgi:hypothetical protein
MEDKSMAESSEDESEDERREERREESTAHFGGQKLLSVCIPVRQNGSGSKGTLYL